MRKINIRKSLEGIVLGSAALLVAASCTGRLDSTPTPFPTDTPPAPTATALPTATLFPTATSSPTPPPTLTIPDAQNLTAFKLMGNKDELYIIFAYGSYNNTPILQEIYGVSGINGPDWYLTTGPIASSSILTSIILVNPSGTLGSLLGFRLRKTNSDNTTLELALDTNETGTPDTFQTYEIITRDDDGWLYLRGPTKIKHDRNEDGLLDSNPF